MLLQAGRGPNAVDVVGKLARILCRSARAIKCDLRHSPERLPPALQVPGTKLHRLRQEVVEVWFASQPCAASTEAKRR